MMTHYLSGSYYIRNVFEAAFRFDFEAKFGFPFGLIHCPLEHHGTQLQNKHNENNIVSASDFPECVKHIQ